MCLVRNMKILLTMTSNASKMLKSKVLALLYKGELNPHRIGEVEAKIGCPLNLSVEDVAWAMAAWENRQEYL